MLNKLNAIIFMYYVFFFKELLIFIRNAEL